MERNIRNLLDELYETYPSFQKDESSLVPMIEMFLKTNVSIQPRDEFKKELKQKLLQWLTFPPENKSLNFFKNLKFFVGFLATSLATYGMFTFYYVQIRPVSSIVSSSQSVSSHIANVPERMTPNTVGVEKNPQEIATSLSVNSSGGNSLQSSIVSPSLVWSASKISEEKKWEITLSSKTNVSSSYISRWWNPSKGHQTSQVNESDKILSSDSQESDSWKSISSQENFLYASNSWLYPNNNQLWDDFWRNLLRKNTSSIEWASESLSIENLSPSQYNDDFQGEKGFPYENSLPEINSRIQESPHVKEKTIPSLSEYTFHFDESKEWFYIVFQKKHRYSTTVNIDKNDIPSSEEIITSFYHIMKEAWISTNRTYFDEKIIQKALEENFDESIIFNLSHKIFWQNVYDEQWNQIFFQAVYSIPYKSFLSIGPLYNLKMPK